MFRLQAKNITVLLRKIMWNSVGSVRFFTMSQQILWLQSISLLSFNIMLIQMWKRKIYYSLLDYMSQQDQNICLNHLQIGTAILRIYSESQTIF